MLIVFLLATHIAVLGYWLGSELVINSTYRYVSYHGEMRFADRKKLMDHVMDVDQHVRYALVLQAGLGSILGLLLGYFPGGEQVAIVAAVIAVLWLVFVEVIHRSQKLPRGARLATIDRAIRYVLLLVLIGIWLGMITDQLKLQPWLGWKLLCFAGVIASGIGIRLQLLHFFKLWPIIEHEGSTPEREARIQQIYVRATSVLVVLWSFIAAIVYLSIWKPA